MDGRPPLLDIRTLFRQTLDDMKRMSADDVQTNGIVYTYPGGQYDFICASDKWFLAEGYEAAFGSYEDKHPSTPDRAPREKGKKSEGEDRLRSMRRARAMLRRLALANEFQYFVTLTLDGSKIDRWDGAAIVKALNTWCDNMVRRKGLRYILVPERHKDGAFHFHGFFGGDGLEVVDSGTIDVPWSSKPRRPRDDAERAAWLAQGGHIVYNLPQWSLGFTTALELYGDYSSAVGYVCKYIGKQDQERPLGRWYYSGGGLEKPRKHYVMLDYRQLQEDYAGQTVELDIPGSKILVVHGR